MNLQDILPLVIPILLVEVVLIVVCLWDLLKADRRVRGDSKLLWGVVIVFVNLVGPILYLVWGRREE